MARVGGVRLGTVAVAVPIFLAAALSSVAVDVRLFGLAIMPVAVAVAVRLLLPASVAVRVAVAVAVPALCVGFGAVVMAVAVAALPTIIGGLVVAAVCMPVSSAAMRVAVSFAAVRVPAQPAQPVDSRVSRAMPPDPGLCGAGVVAATLREQWGVWGGGGGQKAGRVTYPCISLNSVTPRTLKTMPAPEMPM